VQPIVARPNGDSETDGEIQFVRVASRGDPSSTRDLRWSRRGLRTVVRDARPDLVHVVGDPWTPTAEAGAAAARDLKIPYVLVGTSCRGGAKGITARWQSDRVRQGAAALAGTVRPALDLLTGGPVAVPTAILPPGGLTIPPRRGERRPGAPVVFASVGRLVEERGLDTLLDALAATFGEWRLRIVGTGPAHEAIEQQAQRLGLSARTEWLGALPRQELPHFWQEVDVLVAPARSTPEWVEPTGNVVLQAMAYGIAPVVTRCGALPDVVSDAGLIVDEQDSAALARAVQGLVADPGRCSQLGAEARERVLTHYGDGPVADRLVALWRRVRHPAGDDGAAA
jgi:glycosyltransferase involved in cell wall biosynthesis